MSQDCASALQPAWVTERDFFSKNMYTYIFSHSVDCLFTFFIVSFDITKILILKMSNLSFFFSFVTCTFDVILKNRDYKDCSVFSSFSSDMNHFELVFCML